MSQAFFDPNMSRTFLEAAAEEWGKAAADLAKAKKQNVDRTSIDNLLNEAESKDLKELKQNNRAAWQEIRDLAEDRAETRAQFMGL
jgi:hypothetical protein